MSASSTMPRTRMPSGTKQAINAAKATWQATADKKIGTLRSYAAAQLSRINEPGRPVEKRLQLAVAALTKLSGQK